jgi:hypothetical protein
MKRVIVSLALVAFALSLSACAYDPYYYDRPYGYREYPPPPPPGYGPPPPGYAGPGPQQPNGPPPGYDGPDQQGPQAPLTQRQIAKMNDPTWCNAHPNRCAALRARAGGQPDQGYNGPPPGANGAAPGQPRQLQNAPPPGGYGAQPPQQGGPPPDGDDDQ